MPYQICTWSEVKLQLKKNPTIELLVKLGLWTGKTEIYSTKQTRKWQYKHN